MDPYKEPQSGGAILLDHSTKPNLTLIKCTNKFNTTAHMNKFYTLWTMGNAYIYKCY